MPQPDKSNMNFEDIAEVTKESEQVWHLFPPKTAIYLFILSIYEIISNNFYLACILPHYYFKVKYRNSDYFAFVPFIVFFSLQVAILL